MRDRPPRSGRVVRPIGGVRSYGHGRLPRGSAWSFGPPPVLLVLLPSCSPASCGTVLSSCCGGSLDPHRTDSPGHRLQAIGSVPVLLGVSCKHGQLVLDLALGDAKLGGDAADADASGLKPLDVLPRLYRTLLQVWPLGLV